jgi:FolB domain-containing protein
MQAKLKIENLETEVYLGWPDKERKELQRVIINIELRFKNLKALHSDDLEDTICYDYIEKILTSNLKAQEFKLLERLTYYCYEVLVKTLPPGIAFTVGITKFLGAPYHPRTFEISTEE